MRSIDQPILNQNKVPTGTTSNKAGRNKIPLLSTDLIEQLDEMYPETCIGPNESVEAAHRRAGKRDLINRLVKLNNQ